MRNFLAFCVATCVILAGSAAHAQSLAISIGVRETGSAAPIGDNGGTVGGIEWINLDAQFLPFDGNWHQFAFNFGTDPVTSFAGNGVLDGTRGTLEHIRFRNIAGITDPITVFVDDVVNTVSGNAMTLTGFESSEPPVPTVGDSEVMFRNAKFSGSTEPFVLPGATSVVTDLQARSGTQSLKLDWTFVNGVTTNWVRDTTFNSPKYPNPTIDWTSGNLLSFWLRAEIGAPAQRWINPGGGDWDDPSNWGTGIVPNGPTAVANFLDDVTNDATIVLNNPITANTVRLKSTHSYSFVGGPSQNMLTLSGPAESSQNINVEQGSHTFFANVLLDANAGTFGVMNLNVAQAMDVLRFNGDFTISNSVPLTFFKHGAGLVEMKKLEATGDRVLSPLDLRVSAGTLRFVPGGGISRVNALTTLSGSGGRLDITDNPLVIEYPAATPLASVRSQIASAYNGGAWDEIGIGSSLADANAFGVGYAEATALPSIPPIFGTVSGEAILIALARYGDANMDGTVNLTDFNRLAANFGSGDATWFDGDFNYDGMVNLTDFNRLAANFGLSASPDGPTPDDWAALASAVPEPAAGAFVVLLAVPLLRRCKKARNDFLR